MTSSLIEFRSPSRSLQIWIPTGMAVKQGFSARFIDGVFLATQEQAEHMRKYFKHGTSYVEVKVGAILPKRPSSLEPVMIRHTADESTPVVPPVLKVPPTVGAAPTPEQVEQFTQSYGATTQEFEPPARHIHVETSEEAAERESQIASATPAPTVRQPIRTVKAPAKENTDVATHKGT
jgi:hypothetical protein